MSKRKLSKQQTNRIRTNRQSNGSADTSGNLGELEDGIVISRLGNKADIETQSGNVIRCSLRSHMGTPVAGDKVKWRPDGDHGVVESVSKRTSELVRPDAYGKMKIVAANVDKMLITIAVLPEPHINLIDRYLVAAANLGLEATILVNKCDLLDSEEQSQFNEILECYENLGFNLLLVSAKSELGFEELKNELAGRTSVFVGQSGVGKSSILQALMPNETIKVGKLSEQIAKGKHTTTNARLYHFPQGGDCIDSPGIREFGLWHLTPEEVIAGFPDLQEYAEKCKFRDCSHGEEPGCELRAAIENNAVKPQRFESYRRIISSLGDVTMKTQN